MDIEEIYRRINSIFRDIFDDESITVTAVTTADDIEDWDSLEHINLILALEEEFGMKFSMVEVTGMKNVGEAAGIIAARASK